MTRLSDELLLAYVDGQLDRPQAGAVAQLARDDYDIASRVKRLQETQGRLMESFSAILRTHQAQPLNTVIRLDDAPESHGFFGLNIMHIIAAALAAILAIGYFSMGGEDSAPSLKVAERLSDAPAASTWQSEVANLHSFISRDTLSSPEQGQTNRDVIAVQLSRFVRRAKPVALPDFSKHGLTLNRGQVMNYQGQRFMQLAYIGKEEQPVALYIMAGGADARMADLAKSDVRTVSWASGGVSFVLAGFLPQDAIRALAVVAQNQIGN
ncbi:MAG: hypothetical protein SGJ17_06765 [Hyphomicrobiales bacterium]|nr:hypothetical protein [Hyphomicrobiales bacterium]